MKTPAFSDYMRVNSRRVSQDSSKKVRTSMMSRASNKTPKPVLPLVILTGESISTPKQFSAFHPQMSSLDLIDDALRTFSTNPTPSSVRHLKLTKKRMSPCGSLMNFVEGKNRIGKAIKETHKLERSASEMGMLVANVKRMRKASKDSLSLRSQQQSVKTSMMKTSSTNTSFGVKKPVEGRKLRKKKPVAKAYLSRKQIVFDGESMYLKGVISGAELGMLIYCKQANPPRFK